MLSSLSRRLTYATAALYGVLGAVLFFGSVQTSALFAWKVTPLVTMTIGAWCLGNAWIAWISARRWQWPLVYAALMYLWVFGVMETAVLIAFRERLQLGTAIAWLYLASLAVNDAAAACGVMDWLRLRPSVHGAGRKLTPDMRIILVGYLALLLVICSYGFSSVLAARGHGGSVFPEKMTPFTLSSFVAFYFSLALSAVPLVWARTREPALHYTYCGYGLIVTITTATFVYFGRFDFTERPLGVIYVGAYVGAAIVAGYLLVRYGTGAPARGENLARGSAEVTG